MPDTERTRGTSFSLARPRPDPGCSALACSAQRQRREGGVDDGAGVEVVRAVQVTDGAGLAERVDAEADGWHAEGRIMPHRNASSIAPGHRTERISGTLTRLHHRQF
jgi:hypothetical protein